MPNSASRTKRTCSAKRRLTDSKGSFLNGPPQMNSAPWGGKQVTRDAGLSLWLMILLFGMAAQTLSALELGTTLMGLMTTHAILVTRFIMQRRLPRALVAGRTSRRSLRP